jgi:hypothetical protein
MTDIILSVAGIIVSVGVPFGLWTLTAFRNDINRVHDRIDAHISNYEIHKITQRR